MGGLFLVLFDEGEVAFDVEGGFFFLDGWVFCWDMADGVEFFGPILCVVACGFGGDVFIDVGCDCLCETGVFGFYVFGEAEEGFHVFVEGGAGL